MLWTGFVTMRLASGNCPLFLFCEAEAQRFCSARLGEGMTVHNPSHYVGVAQSDRNYDRCKQLQRGDNLDNNNNRLTLSSRIARESNNGSLTTIQPSSLVAYESYDIYQEIAWELKQMNGSAWVTFHYIETMYNGNRVDFKVVTNTNGSLSEFPNQSISTEFS